MTMLMNSFSLNMVEHFPMSISVEEIDCEDVVNHVFTSDGDYSAVGHADTAGLFEAELGIPVPCNRTTVRLVSGDRVVVGQYSGPRLPEGSTTLPEGAAIKWLLVTIG